LDEGDQQGTGPGVQSTLDDNGIIPWNAKNGFRSAAAHGLQLCEQGRNVVRGVLAIDHNPMEAGPGDDFGSYVTAQTAPEPDLPPAANQGGLEMVADTRFRNIGHGSIPGALALPSDGSRRNFILAKFLQTVFFRYKMSYINALLYTDSIFGVNRKMTNQCLIWPRGPHGKTYDVIQLCLLTRTRR
jgi:hypothetical protein